MEKDLIFPMFVKQKGQIKIQGFDVLDTISVIKYLATRFKFSNTTLIRMGNDVYDFKTKRKWSLEKKTNSSAKRNEFKVRELRLSIELTSCCILSIILAGGSYGDKHT